MSETVYQCPEWMLHYLKKEYAEACEAFCKQYHACSYEIIQRSVENEEKA